jgi:hypothetical protein
MKNIYYHPRWRNISAGIILIFFAFYLFFIKFIMFKIEYIHNFYDVVPNIKDGLSFFIYKKRVNTSPLWGVKLGVRGICSPAYSKISWRNLQYPAALRRGFFILDLFIIAFCCYLTIVGILFVKNSKIRLKLKFDNDKLIYAKVPKNRKEARQNAVGLGYFEEFNSIKYKDIESLNINYGKMYNTFKILTKDGKEHNLPVAFPKKDKEEILEYINKKRK